MAAKNAVEEPMNIMREEIISDCSNNGEHLATRKTPAVTIVAAWINAETGVGPSIASGSQVCRKSCADLPIAPINKRKQDKFIIVSSKSLLRENTSSKLTEPVAKYKVAIPSIKAKSPTLLTTNAFMAAEFADGFSYQKPISK